MESSSANTLPSSKRLLGLLAFFVISYAIAAIGGLSTTSSVNGWYAEIQKPDWTPPNAVFGPVWTFLYSLIAWVGWRFWLSTPSAERRRTLQLFGLQWFLNALWSPVFFGAQAYVAGAVIILGLVVVISLLIAQGRKIDALAAWALTPYLLWVGYASTLNIGIWYLNR
jgi:tryptophan-rich sensory protein